MSSETIKVSTYLVGMHDCRASCVRLGDPVHRGLRTADQVPKCPVCKRTSDSGVTVMVKTQTKIKKINKKVIVRSGETRDSLG